MVPWCGFAASGCARTGRHNLSGRALNGPFVRIPPGVLFKNPHIRVCIGWRVDHSLDRATEHPAGDAISGPTPTLSSGFSFAESLKALLCPVPPARHAAGGDPPSGERYTCSTRPPHPIDCAKRAPEAGAQPQPGSWPGLGRQ